MNRKTARQIKKPEFTSAVELTPLELNGFACESKHTVLTPELLEKMAHQKKSSL